ncbi:hypothetical protein, partial [Neisseria sicca]|uniref:hypothetical protein n=1 Tax=Neisseria sicca TaxID=490 RepID=UPI003F689EC5
MFDDANPKYFNSPHTPLFHKPKNLYPFYQPPPPLNQPPPIFLLQPYIHLLPLPHFLPPLFHHVPANFPFRQSH